MNGSLRAATDLDSYARLEVLRRDLGKLFGTSLLITGSVEMAERALLETIRLDHRKALGGSSRDTMALAVARRSLEVLQRAKPLSDTQPGSALPLLPDELCTVLRLPSDLRCCFVLRLLIGYTPEQVGLLMKLPRPKVEALTRTTLARFAELATEPRTGTG